MHRLPADRQIAGEATGRAPRVGGIMLGGDLVYSAGGYAPRAPESEPVLPEWSPVRLFGSYHTAGE